MERTWGRREGVLGPVRRFVGAVGGLCGCETDAVVALDLGRVVSALLQEEEVGFRYHGDGFVCDGRLRVGDDGRDDGGVDGDAMGERSRSWRLGFLGVGSWGEDDGL